MDALSTLAVILSFMVWSFLYKNNIFYQIGLQILAGTAVGYLTCDSLQNVWFKNIVPLSQGNLIQILPLALGFMLFAGYSTKYRFISRYPSVVLIASNMGSTAAGAAIAQMFRQATAPVTDINQAIVVIWAVMIILYFVSTIRPLAEGIPGRISSIGQYLMMFGFGIMFGGYMSTSFNTLIERIQFIFWTWLGIGGHA